MKNLPVLMSRPLITIITVNINDLEGLKRTFKSVFNQNWKEFEYIVIDGGSNDGSAEYISSQGSRIDYWISEPDSGIYNAMNKGIRAANGEYLLFINSGDELKENDILGNNVSVLHTEDIIYYDLEFQFQDRAVKHTYPSELDYKFFINGSIGHPATFIKKSLFENTSGYDENYKIVSDWKFFMDSVVKNKCSYRKVNVVLSKFYKDGISTNNRVLVEKERDEILNKYYSDYVRLMNLEIILDNLKRSRLVGGLRKFGFLKYLGKEY